MSVNINPIKLVGPWIEGYALDVHTTSSELLGNNEYGLPVFSNKYSPIGELLNQLKYHRDQDALEPIVETVTAFLTNWNIHIDAIVPVPPSNTMRSNQPVIQVAYVISKRINVELCENCITKIKNTAQLKNVYNRQKREELLAGAFKADEQRVRGKQLLIFDDLYRSGATANNIARLLKEVGAAAVYLLTLTKTRKNL